MADFITMGGINAEPVWNYSVDSMYPALRLRQEGRLFSTAISILFDAMPTIQLEAIVNSRNGSLECGAMARSPELWEHMTQLIEQTIEAAAS